MEALKKDVELYPNLYQRKRSIKFEVSQNGISKALIRLSITYIKNSKTSKSK